MKISKKLSKLLVNILGTTCVFALIAYITTSCSPIVVKTPPTDAVVIPLGGNAYVTQTGANAGEQITDKGIEDWKNSDAIISTYFRLEQGGELDLFLKAKNVPASSEVKVTVGDKSFNIKFEKGDEQIVPIGRIEVKESGYLKVDLQGTKRAGETFAQACNLLISGTATQAGVKCVNDFSFYWGRRGPSVHLNYPFPENETIEWFYNEINVPVGEDPVGTYYMANGFGEGYFGIQVNSETERRVLFSVWSPFTTDDPKEIPETHKIKLLRKGENVNTGEFGSEGSGGQSFMRYNWKAGTSYKFLTHIKPTGKGSTVYTSYFYATDEEKWLLIAEFERPLTDTYYKRAHSFLESFNPNLGYIGRKGCYSNQWALSKEGKWLELNKARFTADETARKAARMDYKGGVTEQGDFFLQNCGFLNDYTTIGSEFERPLKGTAPQIDLSKLP